MFETITTIAVLVPFIALAGSAVAFTWKAYEDSKERRRNHFFELMKLLDSELPIATKVAAVYELRRFPEHKDFIVRFCQRQAPKVSGGGAENLVAEMNDTLNFFK